MGKKQKKERQKLICFCYSIPEADVIAAIANGATTLMDVRRMTNANTGCGGCGEDVKRLLRKEVPKAQAQREKKASEGSSDTSEFPPETDVE